MALLLKLKICLAFPDESTFVSHRLCFEKEKPKDGGKEEGKEPLRLSLIGTDISEDESQAAMERAKSLREERKKVLAGSKADLAALKAELGKAGDQEKKKEGDKEKPKKATEEEKEKLKTGPRIPERAQDAMSGEELREAFKACKSNEERQKLILDQLAKGNVPDSYRKGFRKVSVESNGHKLEWFTAPSGFRLGPDSDPMEFPMNGPMAQAIADATGCTLPNQWMVDRMNEDGKQNAQFVPFFPQVFSTEDAARMRSAAFIETHNSKVKDYAQQNGIDLTKPMYGYFKHVVQQSAEQLAKGQQAGRPEGNLDIYGGIFANGDQVEPGHVGHDIYHDDYSQSIQLNAEIAYLDGKPVKLQDVLSDSDLAGTFGFPPIPKDNKYKYAEWIADRVETIKGMKPGEVLLATDTERTVFDGISDDKVKKGKVVQEFDYTVSQGTPGGHVRFVKTDEGDIAVMDFKGKEYQVKVDLNNASGVDKSKAGYGASESDIAGPFAYVLLRYFKENGGKVGDIIPFEYNGKQFLAEYQIHPPDASAPEDHPGVGIMQKKETDKVSQIPVSAGGLPSGGVEPQPQPAPREEARVEPPKKGKVGGGGMGGGAYTGGGGAPSVAATYSPSPGGGGAPNVIPASSFTGAPQPAPSFAPSYAPSYKPQAPKFAERREIVPGKINGNTLFLGDSIFASTRGAPMEVNGERRTFAKGGMSSKWLLDQLENLRDGKATDSSVPVDFTLDMFKNGNGVVLIGTNDLGSIGSPLFTKEKIWERIQAIWKILEDLGMTVYACTIPPFGGYTWKTYGSRYDEVNANRKWINEQIIASGRKVIRIDQLVADPADPDRIGPEYKFGNDKVHPNPLKLARLLQSEISKDQQANAPQEKPNVPSDTGSNVAATTVPERPKDAPTGSQFTEELKTLPREKQMERVAEELAKGNIPPFLWKFKEVNLEAVGPSGTKHTATIRVMPDYLCVGTDEDHVYVAMNGILAKFVAERYDCILPTEKLVNDIEANSTHIPFYAYGSIPGVAPATSQGQPDMAKPNAFFGHTQLITQFLGGKLPEGIVSGHKKDVIYHNWLQENAKKLQIYGGLYENGSRVQYSAGEPGTGRGNPRFHEITHWDYSQGARLISKNMIIDGQPKRAEDVLSDPELAPLLNNDGVMDIGAQYNESHFAELDAYLSQLAAQYPKMSVGEPQQKASPQQPAENLPPAFDILGMPSLIPSLTGEGYNEKVNGSPSPSPQKAKTGIDQKEQPAESRETEEVEFEFTYGLEGEGGDARPARIVRTAEGRFVEYNDIYGKAERVPVDLDAGIIPVDELKKSYTIGALPGTAHLAYVLLYLCIKMQKPAHTVITYTYNGIPGAGRFETHNDGPGGPIPFDHPGVGVWHA